MGSETERKSHNDERTNHKFQYDSVQRVSGQPEGLRGRDILWEILYADDEQIMYFRKLITSYYFLLFYDLIDWLMDIIIYIFLFS